MLPTPPLLELGMLWAELRNLSKAQQRLVPLMMVLFLSSSYN
jgi:hypothetical protein